MHTLLATVTDNSAATAAGSAGTLVASLVGYLISCAAYYGIFKKAGEPTWQAFVPVWNSIVLLKVAGKPMWWIVLFLIPVVNIVFAIMAMHALSVSFGHGAGFTVGLVLLPIIFLFVLGYSSNTYRGPGGVGAAAPQAYATV